MEMHTARSRYETRGVDGQQMRRPARARPADSWRFIGFLAHRLVVARAARRALRDLDRLDDRLLADIGMTRPNVDRRGSMRP